MVCVFFGHRDTSIEICPKLKETIINLIEKNNVTVNGITAQKSLKLK